MDGTLKDVLYRLVHEIEDLRAHQFLSTVVLKSLPDLRTTDLDELKNQAFEKNKENYEALRQTIAEL